MQVLNIQFVSETCYWLKLQVPSFHMFYTSFLPINFIEKRGTKQNTHIENECKEGISGKEEIRKEEIKQRKKYIK